MRYLKLKDFLVASAFSFNIATIISYIMNIPFLASLFLSTIFLGLAVYILIMEMKE